MRAEAVAAMLPFLSEHAANPSGSHGASRVAKTALEEARETVAEACAAAPGPYGGVMPTGGLRPPPSVTASDPRLRSAAPPALSFRRLPFAQTRTTDNGQRDGFVLRR